LVSSQERRRIVGQLAKEATHNESLARLDFLIGAAVLEVGRETLPTAPLSGDCYIVGDNPNGDWTGQARSVASSTESGWRFASATVGMVIGQPEALHSDRSTGCIAQFDGAQWLVRAVRAMQISISGKQVIGAQQPAIADHASN